MHRKQLLILLMVLLTPIYSAYSQDKILYKQVDTVKLFLEVHYPEKMDASKGYPSVVFFFGGGWISGDRSHFSHHAEYFIKRGLCCFLVDYRTRNKHETTPFESLKDAKSAIRFIRENAEGFNIDPEKIIAAGGSAGGHLAAATALVEAYNDETDDLEISCIPNALVLFNPVIDNGPGGYGYDRIGNEYKDFSPLHNLKEGTPPTIIFLGTEDKLVPVETAEYFQVVTERLGSRCDLKLYEGQGHGFFNYSNFEYYKQTVLEADKFLQSLGYLMDVPIVNIE